MMLELAALSLLARQEQRDLMPEHWSMLPRAVRCALSGPIWLNGTEVELLITRALVLAFEDVDESRILAELRATVWERANEVQPHHAMNPWIPPKLKAHAQALMALLEPDACVHDDDHALLPERRAPEMRRALERLGLLRPAVVVSYEDQPI